MLGRPSTPNPQPQLLFSIRQNLDLILLCTDCRPLHQTTSFYAVSLCHCCRSLYIAALITPERLLTTRLRLRQTSSERSWPVLEVSTWRSKTPTLCDEAEFELSSLLIPFSRLTFNPPRYSHHPPERSRKGLVPERQITSSAVPVLVQHPHSLTSIFTEWHTL